MDHRKSPPILASADDSQAGDQALYQFLVESLTDHAVFAVSSEGTILSWNSGAQKIFGYTNTEIVGSSFDIIFTPRDLQLGSPQGELANAIRDGCSQQDRWHVRKDGSRFWGTNSVQPLYDRGGTLLGFTKLVRDTTASHLAGEHLSDSEQQLRILLASVHDYAIFSLELDGVIRTWSGAAEQLFGYVGDEIIGRSFSVLFAPVDVTAGLPGAQLHDAAIHDAVNMTSWLVRKDGSAFLANGKMSRLKTDAAGDLRGFVVVTHDMTEQQAAVDDMRHKAQHDALTQLANRPMFYEHMQRAISLVKRRSSQLFAVLFIDLDHFKTINDEFGHIIADHVLTSIARRLELCARVEDFVARLGGDEFAILLTGINGVVDASDAAQRILAEMQKAVKTDAGDVFATVSIGIAIGTSKYESPPDVLRDADAAMYVAKSQGRARAVVFNDSIGKVIRDNADLTTDLRHALERNELRMSYQPILRLHDRTIAGFEALVRWKHPRRGLLLPNNFIPQAEDSNLIITLDRWVLRRACDQLVNWQNRRLVGPDVQMSINISSKEFSRPDFIADVQDVLLVSTLGAKSLRLEITEGTILERSSQAYEMLAAVRSLGVSVDVDDFGTGYASLGALNNILADGLKIDWSFVTSENAYHGWRIVESVISLAHKLGLVATAEGIETADQLRRLIALGCDFGQGHLFAPPLGAVAAAAFLRDTRL